MFSQGARKAVILRTLAFLGVELLAEGFAHANLRMVARREEAEGVTTLETIAPRGATMRKERHLSHRMALRAVPDSLDSFSFKRIKLFLILLRKRSRGSRGAFREQENHGGA